MRTEPRSDPPAGRWCAMCEREIPLEQGANLRGVGLTCRRCLEDIEKGRL